MKKFLILNTCNPFKLAIAVYFLCLENTFSVPAPYAGNDKTLTLENYKECPAKNIFCNSGRCINLSLLCDGTDHCKAGYFVQTDTNDLANLCDNVDCPVNKFRCLYGGCINKNLRCDGISQCADGSDEVGCENHVCPRNKFRCAQGICLDQKFLCDGECYCAGCGDETEELCANRTCPQNTYRCDYGGCLRKEFQCDGIKHCRNGADESSTLCKENVCPRKQFRCSTGSCLRSRELCNGHCDCNTCEDENANLCKDNTCPGNRFRCNYGGCIYLSHVCNGVWNCNDGSDEDSDLCSVLKQTTSCTLPWQTPDNKFTVRCPGSKNRCRNTPRVKVPNFSQITITCNPGYTLKGSTVLKSGCSAGTWTPPLKTCIKTCDTLKSENMDFKCYYHNTSFPVDCNETPVEGIIVYPSCTKLFQSKLSSRHRYDYIACKSTGKWTHPLFECIPECGQSYGNATNLISGGQPEKYGDSPWHVAIYSTTRSSSLDFICGGTIISDTIIISAAHCFRNENNNRMYEPSYFEIVVGKLTRSYSIKNDEKFAKTYKVKKIFVPIVADLTADKANFAGDIAVVWLERKITFSQGVLPACVDFSQSSTFEPREKVEGKLVGWGLNEKGEPSETLLRGLLPFINNHVCRNMVNSDFRNYITPDKFCAGSSTGVGATQGDSGGGILFKDSHTDKYFIRGIVSNKNSSNSSIATFTDIAVYTEWIGMIQDEIKSGNVRK